MHRPLPQIVLLSVFLLPPLWDAKPGKAGEIPVPVEKIDSFLGKHCYQCHDELTTKAGLDLYALSTDLSDAEAYATWERIFDRVALGEMPPPSKPQPTAGEKRLFADLLSPSLTAAHQQKKGTVLRRLNNREYENTINDLLGIRLSLADTLPEDARSHGFDTIGEALGISMIQLKRYLE
ncbi:MAG: DUF1587 domain-containing protein, partial [Verrucomicrobiota bacterium]